MLEITRKNCKVETESKWLSIFDKQGNSSALKYRRELTPNIKSQPDRIFVRNDLFERIIKGCKVTYAEFTMLKEKLGICPYEENYYEEEIIKMQDDIEELDEELIEIINHKKMKHVMNQIKKHHMRN